MKGCNRRKTTNQAKYSNFCAVFCKKYYPFGYYF